MSGDDSTQPASLNPTNSGQRQFRYLHRYTNSEYVETLAFPVGWLDANGLTYRDGGVYRDGVLLAPHEYPPFEPDAADPPAKSLLDRIIQEAAGYFPGDDFVIETD